MQFTVSCFVCEIEFCEDNSKKHSYSKFMDFMTPSSSRAQTNHIELPPPMKRSSHCDNFDMKWND